MKLLLPAVGPSKCASTVRPWSPGPWRMSSGRSSPGPPGPGAAGAGLLVCPHLSKHLGCKDQRRVPLTTDRLQGRLGCSAGTGSACSLGVGQEPALWGHSCVPPTMTARPPGPRSWCACCPAALEGRPLFPHQCRAKSLPGHAPSRVTSVSRSPSVCPSINKYPNPTAEGLALGSPEDGSSEEPQGGVVPGAGNPHRQSTRHQASRSPRASRPTRRPKLSAACTVPDVRANPCRC